MCQKDQDRQGGTNHGRKSGAVHSHIHGEDKNIVQDDVGDASGDHTVHCKLRGAVIAHKSLEVRGKEESSHTPDDVRQITHDIRHRLLRAAQHPGDLFHKYRADDHTNGEKGQCQQKGSCEIGIRFLFFTLAAGDGHKNGTADTGQQTEAKENIVDRKRNVQSSHGDGADALSDHDRIGEHIDGSHHSSKDGRKQIMKEKLPDRCLKKILCVHCLSPLLFENSMNPVSRTVLDAVCAG